MVGDPLSSASRMYFNPAAPAAAAFLHQPTASVVAAGNNGSVAGSAPVVTLSHLQFYIQKLYKLLNNCI